MTFILNDFKVDHKVILSDIKEVIKKHSSNQRYKFEVNMPRKDKSGWLLGFKDTTLGIDIDIMVNKTASVHNSNLILQYAQLDERFNKVVAVLKQWNKNLSSTPFNKLNSFTLTLMLIAVMQREGILPNL